MTTALMPNGGPSRPATGDPDLAAVAALVADPGRCRMLLALNQEGRELSATRLAAEAGVSAATASAHLGKLVAGGLLSVETRGRFRLYRLSGPVVARLLESLQQLAPGQPIRSLRQSIRADALRAARTCYDHLAGRVGVALMSGMLGSGHLEGGDGIFDEELAVHDRRAAYGRDLDYRLTEQGMQFLADFGVQLPPRRPAIRYCVDWTEQRHHLSGGLGRGLLDRFLELDWVRRTPNTRAVELTPYGARGLRETFGVES
jgi:DNA-binding transcriptional ArsR family regulator